MTVDPALQTLAQRPDFQNALQHSSFIRPYDYEPLRTQANTREIRLLHLYPGDGPLPLFAELIHCDVDNECGSYEALSDFWGPPQFTKVIICKVPSGDLRRLNITPSLHDALSHLRFKSDYCLIWANAVCIYSYRIAIKRLGNLRFMPQFVLEWENLRSVLLRKKPCSGPGFRTTYTVNC